MGRQISVWICPATGNVEALCTLRVGWLASVPRTVFGDVDDDLVITAAVAACADLIVSGNRKHLLPLGGHQGIDIVDAAEAVRCIAGA